MHFSPIEQLAIAAPMAAATMFVLWLRQQRTGKAGIVDLGWTLLVGALGVFFAVTADGFGPRRWAAAAMVAAWSLRLSGYLWFGRLAGQPEEGRYRRLRNQWGDAAGRKFLVFFQYQAAAAVFFALPMMGAAHREAARWTIFDSMAVLLWLIAVINTALADWQLARFKADSSNRGRTCRTGWWRFSRHPNYFFEWLHWCSYALLTVGSAWAWLSVGVAISMLYFLLCVTGIPPTEAQALASRGDEYRRYMQTTSAFVPWFPRKEAAP